MIGPNARILFQGDSITDAGRQREAAEANDTTALGCGYAQIAAATLLAERPGDDLQCFNRGVSGDRIVDLHERWQSQTIQLQPTVLSVLIGINDLLHGYFNGNGIELPRFQTLYRQLLTWTREALPEVGLVLGEPFALPCGAIQAAWMDELKPRQEVARSLAEEFGAVFVPYQSMFDAAATEAPMTYWLADGFHPTPAGHGRMAQLWLQRLSAGPTG